MSNDNNNISNNDNDNRGRLTLEENKNEGGNSNRAVVSTSFDNNGISWNFKPRRNNKARRVETLSLDALLYSCRSFHAVVKPVILTMLISALAITYVTTEASLKAGSEGLSEVYTPVYPSAGSGSSSTNTKSNTELLGMSTVNALLIVTAIGAFTFVIVLLYKYRCMKVLMGFMAASTMVLLSMIGMSMWTVAMQRYGWSVDLLSFCAVLWNVSLVGTVAIYVPQWGVPPSLTRVFLVLSSICVAWQLSHFDAWTAWALLVMLAIYDLCAVLTPCGPLKALLKQMQKPDAPRLRGLLYEANLAPHAQQGGHHTPVITDNNNNNPDEQPPAPLDSHPTSTASHSSNSSTFETSLGPSPTHSYLPASYHQPTDRDPTNPNHPLSSTSVDNNHAVISLSTGTIPLAIAQVYRLRIIEPSNLNSRLNIANDNNANVNDALAQVFSSKELKTNVTVEFPLRGGRIQKLDDDDDNDDHPQSIPTQLTTHPIEQPQRFVVQDRFGRIKRHLLLDFNGRVMEVLHDPAYDQSTNITSLRTSHWTNSQRTMSTTTTQRTPRKNFKNTIALGLGDFIFYSLLVSKAAMHSFTTFAACVLVILMGLGGTLILLSVYDMALPALPISIFLGVIFYLLTRIVIEPWIYDIFHFPLYV